MQLINYSTIDKVAETQLMVTAKNTSQNKIQNI